MSADKVTIANRALRMIGGKPITAFPPDDSSREAQAIAAVYDDIRQEVLQEHPWSFAQVRAALATTTAPTVTGDLITIAYIKPAALIAINYVMPAIATIKVESTGILSDTSGVSIIYTTDLDDPTKYSAKFSTALATRLAQEICFLITESVRKSAELESLYQKIRLPSAMAEDSKQSTPLGPMQDDILWGRIYANSNIAPQTPNAQTWHPW